MVFRACVTHWIALHDFCLPATSRSSSADILIYLQFPKLATFSKWFPTPRKTFLRVTILPLHPFTIYPSLTCPHVANSHSFFKVKFMHHILLEACQDPPIGPEELPVSTVCCHVPSAHLDHCTSALCRHRGFPVCLFIRQAAPCKQELDILVPRIAPPKLQTCKDVL